MAETTILVTGAAGFIGSHVIAQLAVDAETRVIGIDNINDYYDTSLKRHRLEQLSSYPQFQFFEGDLTDRPFLSRVFAEHRFDSVINLAARAGVRYSMENPHVYLATNSTGSLNLLEAMQATGASKYVLASTSSLYAGQPMPFSESSPVNEPISPYAASKKAAELMAYSFHHLYDFDVSVVRYFTVYGPAGRPDMSYFRFIQAVYNGDPITVYGDGNQSRDFTHVDDVARGTIAATRNVGYEIINLGRGDQPVSINSIIERIELILNRKANVQYVPEHAADMKSTRADNSKARNLLNWEPQVGIDDGLASCVNWFTANLPWSAKISLETGVKVSERIAVDSSRTV